MSDTKSPPLPARTRRRRKPKPSLAREPMLWALVALFIAGLAIAVALWPGSRSLIPRSIQQTLESSSVIVITALDRTSSAERAAQDYFIRLDADTWYQFKSDPATTTRFIFKQAATQGDQLMLRDATRGVEITLQFDFAKRTVTYRQADQKEAYELFTIASVQSLPK